MEKEYESMQAFSDSLYDEFKIDEYLGKSSFRKTVENYCKKIKVGNGESETTLFEKSKIDPNRRKSRHLLYEEDKTALLLNKEFAHALEMSSTDPNFVTNRIEEKLGYAIANQNFLEDLSHFDVEEYIQELKDYAQYAVSEQELKRIKFEMMIEALFLEHFTPIDEKKLREDMELRNMGGGMDNTPETFEAAKRLEKPTNYYSRKSEE